MVDRTGLVRSIDVKSSIVSAMKRQGANLDSPSRRISIDEATIMSKQLSHFVSVHSRKLLVALNVSLDFLDLDPSEWEWNECYTRAKACVGNLKVVNDAAERGVALIQTFNAILSNQEEQKQYLLQVVEQHRSRFPTAKKSTLVKQLF